MASLFARDHSAECAVVVSVCTVLPELYAPIGQVEGSEKGDIRAQVELVSQPFGIAQ